MSRTLHLVITLLGLLGLRECTAQSCVTIDIENNTRSTAIVPEGFCIALTAGVDLVNATLSSNDSIQHNVSCGGGNCSIMLGTSLPVGEEITVELILTTLEETIQSLFLTIRENLDATCSSYNIPKNFTEDTTMYIFECRPPADLAGVQVQWRKFRQQEDLMDFLNNGGYSTHIISTGGVFNVSEYSLIVDNSGDTDNFSRVAYYYVPSFLINAADELITAETLIFAGPFLEEQGEFSKDVDFNTRHYDEINCEAETFPPSTVSWVLVSEDYEDGVDVAKLDQFELLETGSAVNLTLTFNSTIQMTNLQYEDDGNFTCVASNGHGSNSRWFRLRVKSRLRPLWPALGIIGVAIVVPCLMLVHYTIEKIHEKKFKHYKSRGPAPDRNQRASVSSTSGHANNSKERKHNAVKRLSSNKPLIDESTL